MKNASPALAALLASSNQIYMADLITIAPLQGSPALITGADVNLANASSAYPGDDGLTYLASGIQFVRSKIKTLVGVQVDELEITFYGNGNTLVNGVPFLQAAAGNYLDGAQVKVLRAFMSTFGVVVGSIVQFAGIVSQVDAGRTQAVVKVSSNLQLLNIQMPKNVWQPGCINNLYQSPCNLSRTTFAEIGMLQATAGSGALLLNSASLKPAGYYNLGYVTFTGGANSGVSRTVKSFAAGTFTLMNPLPNAPATNDAFNAYVGCDRQLATCAAYGNAANFRGMPFVPPVSVLT
jgi:uncharacterized phage protein (TIGR02218 family)